MIGKSVSHYQIVEKIGAGGLSLSPDGHFLLYSQDEQSSEELMLVENFR